MILCPRDIDEYCMNCFMNLCWTGRNVLDLQQSVWHSSYWDLGSYSTWSWSSLCRLGSSLLPKRFHRVTVIEDKEGWALWRKDGINSNKHKYLRIPHPIVHPAVLQAMRLCAYKRLWIWTDFNGKHILLSLYTYLHPCLCSFPLYFKPSP